jgi:hypothetical protein
MEVDSITKRVFGDQAMTFSNPVIRKNGKKYLKIRLYHSPSSRHASPGDHILPGFG